MAVKVINDTDHPVTINEWDSTLDRWAGYVHEHFQITDTVSGEIRRYDHSIFLSRWDEPLLRTWDEPNDATFTTIGPRATHVWKLCSSGLWGLEAGRQYAFRIVRPNVRWWAYGTKKELLAPKAWGYRKRRILGTLGIRHLASRYDTCIFGPDGGSNDSNMKKLVVTIVGEPALFSID